MKRLDREALRWARYIATRKHAGWHVTAGLVLAAGFLIAGLVKGSRDGLWAALMLITSAAMNFERRGTQLLRDYPQPVEGERNSARWGALFLVFAVVVILSLKIHP